MTAYASSRAGQPANEYEALKLIAILCGVGQFLSLTSLTDRLDLGSGFF